MRCGGLTKLAEPVVLHRHQWLCLQQHSTDAGFYGMGVLVGRLWGLSVERLRHRAGADRLLKDVLASGISSPRVELS